MWELPAWEEEKESNKMGLRVIEVQTKENWKCGGKKDEKMTFNNGLRTKSVLTERLAPKSIHTEKFKVRTNCPYPAKSGLQESKPMFTEKIAVKTIAKPMFQEPFTCKALCNEKVAAKPLVNVPQAVNHDQFTARTMVMEPLLPVRSKDVVEDLARALLSDCINKRQREALKTFKVEIIKTPSHSSSSSCNSSCGSPKDNKTYEDTGLSCSSSDDELNQLHAMSPSFVWEDNCRDSKSCVPDIDTMLLVNSPESEDFFEERGLPKEVRYSLPIAYGTVNETSKICSICQVAYEIGSHIVTLTPCQHFFHALCVDKWLWNHTTCPLCRTEVVYKTAESCDARGIECPQGDRENMRKKMRSQCAEFRPLHPPVMDNLDVQFSGLQVQDSIRTTLDHLVCPVAQRTWRK
ncbi:hypothetical protein THRCLA_00031 [Thraustotheca clavata]|uniref:RING-type domain-containing protein n=1 Tax=Thraustotheca clavata TaxID=74557 RepID=A0A1W0ACH3_9STRA|nr:hypothetical protein THRCLA_00031 [Thraustotheca clavata]